MVPDDRCSTFFERSPLMQENKPEGKPPVVPEVRPSKNPSFQAMKTGVYLYTSLKGQEKRLCSGPHCHVSLLHRQTPVQWFGCVGCMLPFLAASNKNPPPVRYITPATNSRKFARIIHIHTALLKLAFQQGVLRFCALPEREFFSRSVSYY